MTHFWANGSPIQVWLDAKQQPTQVQWERRMHAVIRIDNQWRIDRGWWRLRIQRDYFKVHTRDGMLIVIYHDLLTDQWYLQRLYD